jgi:ABC-type thiamine transport system ATPase subunit
VLVQTLLQQLIDKEVTVGVQAVEKLHTEGLQAVFGDQDLSVKSVVEVQRGKVSVDLITVQKQLGHEVEGLSNDSFGGAVATVQSVLLRIIILLRRGLRPLLLLDETLPAFDHNYVLNMGAFLSTLCQRLKMDILLVTHNPALVEAADHSYRLVRRNGSVKVEVLK